MKRSTLSGFCWIFLWAAGPVTGWAQIDQPTEFQAGLKIGFVDSLQVLYGTEEGKQEISKIQEFIEEKQKEYDSRRMELERLREQLETQQRTLNPQTQADMQRTLDEKDRRLRRFQEDTQVDINRRRDELLGRMTDKIQVIINEYAQKNNFRAIFLRGESQVYVDLSLDLTGEIIRIYNERYPVSTAQSSTSTATPTQP
ncbi:OmpH family outer membrane protein [Acidobacteria bacterium AH-259-O06]|nr:OmpH family outer membrane protein [Acidobacteria bacterium AH-259-O06]